MVQEFGGIWTVKKLSVLRDYLSFYTNALNNKPFKLHHVDAFAGSGEHRPSQNVDQQVLVPEQNLMGSVETALAISPPFDEYHFNDIDPLFTAKLERISAEHSDKTIKIHTADANQFVPHFCSQLRGGDRQLRHLRMGSCS